MIFRWLSNLFSKKTPQKDITEEDIHLLIQEALTQLVQNGKYADFGKTVSGPIFAYGRAYNAEINEAECELMVVFMKLNPYRMSKTNLIKARKLCKHYMNQYLNILLDKDQKKC